MIETALDLSIIIISYNTRELLMNCLRSVEASTSGCALEIFVVDNASRDGSPALVHDRFPQVRLINNNHNLGFARANNLALQQAGGRYALLLNSDTIVRPGNLEQLIGFADAHPHAGLIGVQLVNSDGSFQASFNNFPSLGTAIAEAWGLMPRLSGNLHYPSRPPEQSQLATKCDWVGGACLLARRAALNQVGLLDESYFMNSEEVDWAYRMQRGGWQVWYTPDVQVIHMGGGSADRLSATQRARLYAGKVRFIQNRYGVRGAWLVKTNYRIASLIKAGVYALHYGLRRQAVDRNRAQSHVQVALKRSWP